MLQRPAERTICPCEFGLHFAHSTLQTVTRTDEKRIIAKNFGTLRENCNASTAGWMRKSPNFGMQEDIVKLAHLLCGRLTIALKKCFNMFPESACSRVRCGCTTASKQLVDKLLHLFSCNTAPLLPLVGLTRSWGVSSRACLRQKSRKCAIAVESF